MNFSEALNHVKNGKLIARKGWNGKGMFVFLRPEFPTDSKSVAKFVSVVPEAKKYFFEIADAPVVMSASLSMKTADGNIMTAWTPSTLDLFAEDWKAL